MSGFQGKKNDVYPKHWYLYTNLEGIMLQKTVILILPL
jgi:hypothetical protein